MVTQLRQMKIFTGSAHPDFTQKVADTLGVPMASSKLFRFSDGEIGLSIEESVRGADVYVVQPTSEPVNENLMELLIMIDALRRASAYRINVVTPYFGYARQDRKTKAREPITSKLVANLIEKAGADRLVVADLHAGQIKGIAEFENVGGHHTQVFSDDRQVGKSRLDGFEECLAGTFHPSANFSSWIAVRNLPVTGETSKVIKPDDINDLQYSFKSFDPPGIALFFVSIPAVKRVSPELTGG